METGKPCTNTLYFGFCCSYLKNEFGDTNILLLKSDQHGRIELSAKLSGFRANLNFQLYKVVLNLLHRIFFLFLVLMLLFRVKTNRGTSTRKSTTFGYV